MEKAKKSRTTPFELLRVSGCFILSIPLLIFDLLFLCGFLLLIPVAILQATTMQGFDTIMIIMVVFIVPLIITIGVLDVVIRFIRRLGFLVKRQIDVVRERKRLY